MVNSLQESDAAAAAIAVAPRVSLVDIEEAIHTRFDMTGAEATNVIDGQYQPLDILSLCILVLRNGYTVVGKAAPASALNFDRELGRKLAYEDAIRQCWPLMGFALRDRQYREAFTEVEG